MERFLIYLIFQMDSVKDFLEWIVIFITMGTAGLGLLGTATFYSAYNDQEIKQSNMLLKYAKKGFILLLILGVPLVFIPDTKTVAAVYLIPKLKLNKLSTIETKLYQVLENKLDDMVKGANDE